MELIDLTIEDDVKDASGVTAIATVDSPAIEQGYFAFGSNKELKTIRVTCGSQKGNFAAPIGDRQILAGALMIPDMAIPRIDDKTKKEYNVKFSAKTIEQIVKKHAKLSYANNVNQMHDNTRMINDSYLYQSFIINRAMGVNPPLGQEHLPDGTWFGFIYIGDKNVWDEYIKTGIYTGFSVEGNFYESVATELSDEFCAHFLSVILE
jgi:hypothetical protein